MKKLNVLLAAVLLALLLTPSGLAAVQAPVVGIETSGQGPVLETVKLATEKEQIRLEMIFDGEIEYTSMIWQDPFRVVVDVKNGTYRNWFTQLDRKDWLFRQVRIFEHRYGLRIVLELQMAGPEYQLVFEPTKKMLLLTVPRRFTILSKTELAEGVEYLQIKRGLGDGLALVQALQVDVLETTARKLYPQVGGLLARTGVALKTAYRGGAGGVKGLSKISDLVKQEGGYAGINGGFFSGDGSPLGLLIQDGRLISQPLYNRTAWGIDIDGQMRIGSVGLSSEVVINGQIVPLSGVNRVRSADELIAYSPEFGLTTQSNEWGLEVIVQNGLITTIRANNSPIPANGWVLSGHGKMKTLLESLKVGDQVDVNIGLTPDWLTERVQYAIGGGPRLVQAGQVFITGREEQFKPDILIGRAPRTALGITPENHLLMVVVDGRSEASTGMSLQELAELMLDLGAYDALNLDGGKSSTFVIGDEVRNAPSAGKEIPVHNGLILLVDPNTN